MKCTCASLLIVLFCHSSVGGQDNAARLADAKQVLTKLKNATEISYKYTMDIEYPNGQKDRLIGSAYLNTAGHLLFNTNQYQTILYTSHYSYKANHKDKNVVLVNNEKHLGKEYKKKMEKDFFEGDMISVFLDSILSKKGTVRSYIVKNDTVNIELSFPAQSRLKSISIYYTEKEKKIISYRMNIFTLWENNDFGKNRGTTEVVKCNDFNTSPGQTNYLPDNFFTINKGEASLKQYTKYKLLSKL